MLPCHCEGVSAEKPAPGWFGEGGFGEGQSTEVGGPLGDCQCYEGLYLDVGVQQVGITRLLRPVHCYVYTDKAGKALF
jgi:hypothetical protein